MRLVLGAVGLKLRQYLDLSLRKQDSKLGMKSGHLFRMRKEVIIFLLITRNL